MQLHELCESQRVTWRALAARFLCGRPAALNASPAEMQDKPPAAAWKDTLDGPWRPRGPPNGTGSGPMATDLRARRAGIKPGPLARKAPRTAERPRSGPNEAARL